MGIATRIVQVAPTASVIEYVIGTGLTATWRLETLDGTPIPNRVLGLYIDHGTAPFVDSMTNGSGLVSWNIGSHSALYVGSTWDFDARFAGDATYNASASPYITLNVVASSQTCRDIHPAHECLNEYWWDCVNTDPVAGWQNTGEFCGVIPPTCRDSHPTSECISYHLYDCVTTDPTTGWQDTGQSCGSPPTCRDAHPTSECIGGLWYDCLTTDPTTGWQSTGYPCETPPTPTTPWAALAIGGALLIGMMALVVAGGKKKK